MKNGLHCDNFIENFRLTIAPLLGQRINKKKRHFLAGRHNEAHDCKAIFCNL